MPKNNLYEKKSHNGIMRQIRLTYDDLIEYANSLFEPTPKERVVCVPKDVYDMIEELRRNNYDKNINK
jgi:hypothetical protein